MTAMDMTLTLGALLAGLALMGAMSYVERRPRQNLDARLVPTTPLMFAGALVAILAAVHLLTVLGVQLPKR
jgi:hypothetical protein